MTDDVVLRFLTGEVPWSVEVQEVCGAAHFDYTWTAPDVRDATLLDQTRFVIGSQHGIEVVDRDKRIWSDSFKKGEVVQEMEADEKGDTIALAVAKYVGGSQLLDINGHLKVMKIIIYRAADGKRTAELVIEHPPRWHRVFLRFLPTVQCWWFCRMGFCRLQKCISSAQELIGLRNGLRTGLGYRRHPFDEATFHVFFLTEIFNHCSLTALAGPANRVIRR